MKYMILDTNNGWFKAFEGSEDEAIKETERLSVFHDRRYSLHDDMGHLVGGTYIPEPIYVFLRG
jgi:hypothetical protein